MPNATVCEKYEAEEVPFLYGNPTEAYRYFCLGFGIFVCLYLIVGFGLFCYYQPKLVRLQNRSMYMNFCLMAAFLLLNVTIYLREFIGREHFPCQVLLWSFYLSIYFAAGAIVGSQYLYLYKLRSQREQGNLVALIWKNRGREQRVQSDHTNQSTSARSIDKTKNFFAFLFDFIFVLKHSKDGKIGTMLVQVDERDDASSINGSDSVMSNPLFLFSSDSPNKDYSISMREKLIQTFALPTVLMMTFGAPLIIAAAVRSVMEPPFYNLCNGCKLSWVDYLILTLCGIENMVMMAIGLYAMRREADPIGIFYEVKVASMAGVVVILGWLLQSLDAGGVYRDYKFTWDILYSIGSCFCYFPTVYGQIINTFNERRLIEQRRSTIDAASRADESHNVARVIPHINGHGGATAAHGYSVTNLPPVTALDLNMIITEPRARTALLEHCVDELSSENLAFVFKVRAWKQAYDREVPQKINKVGINMYKEYVSRTSKTPINIPNNICVHVDKLIEPYLASEEASGNDGVSPLTHGKIPRTIFDACENECLKIIRTDTLPRFRNSKLFKERIIETGILEKILN